MTPRRVVGMDGTAEIVAFISKEEERPCRALGK
jgi:hypothetical protein